MFDEDTMWISWMAGCLHTNRKRVWWRFWRINLIMLICKHVLLWSVDLCICMYVLSLSYLNEYYCLFTTPHVDIYNVHALSWSMDLCICIHIFWIETHSLIKLINGWAVYCFVIFVGFVGLDHKLRIHQFGLVSFEFIIIIFCTSF